MSQLPDTLAVAAEPDLGWLHSLATPRLTLHPQRAGAFAFRARDRAGRRLGDLIMAVTALWPRFGGW